MKITLNYWISTLIITIISINSFATPMSGTYTINSSLPTSGTNFTSFNNASNSLTANGVSGPVVILVKQGTYTEQVIFTNITGTSAVNSITIKADPTNTASAKIEYNAASSVANNYVIRFSNANYITVDSLEISSTTGATYGKLVDFTSTNSHITFRNNALFGSRNLSNNDNFSIFYENTGATNVSGNLTFDNNTIEGGSNAFYINSSGSAHQSNFFITNNTVMYSSDYGVYANESSNVQVIGNYFEDDTNRNTTLHVIYITYSDSASDIKGNNIQINSGLGHTYAIRTTYVLGTMSNPMHIENNMVYMDPSSTKLQYGLNMQNCLYQNIYHNSIKVNCSWSSYGRPIYISQPASSAYGKINIVNNIFFNNQGTNALYTSSGMTGFIDSLDYNVYYSTGTPFRYNNTNYTTLAAMQIATGKDAHSIFGDPGFLSASDLHLVGTIADNVGDNSIGVITDIDGQTRPFSGSTTVDIGADEYSLVACPPPSFLSDVKITHDSVYVSWTQGPNDISWIIEYGATGFSPGSGTIINTTNDTLGVGGLTPSACYDVYLRSICSTDSSALVGPFNFCTPCAPLVVPYLQDFATMSNTAPPACWLEGKGFLSSSIKVIEGYSAWTSDDFGNVGSLGTGAARSELGYTNINDWLVSPLIDLGTSTSTNYQVEFKIAITEYNGSGAPTGGSIALDDKVVFLISTNYGTTWSTANILRQWDSTDLPSASGEYFSYNLTAAGYTGVVRFAFYTQSTINNTRNEVHIDDFSVDAVPTCPDPSALMATGNSTTSVSVSWTNGASDVSWLLEHGPVGFMPGTGTATAVATSGTGTISSLTSSSLYDVYLRSICGAADSSRYIGPLKIQTTCVAQSDFCEDFSNKVDSTILPVCWSKFNNSSVTNTLIQIDNSAGQGYAGNEYLIMNNSTDLTSTLMLISPEISNLSSGTHRANFWARENGASGDSSLIIGTIANPSNPGTFTPFDTISLTTVYSNHRIDFSSYSGTDDYVAFLWLQRTTNDRVYIDEFCWEAVPSCEKAFSASVLNSGQDSTNLNLGWTTDPAQTSYIIWYGPAGYTPGASSQIGNTTTTGNFVTINSLTPLTEYCFWVKSVCTSGDTSLWEGPICGRTGCPGEFGLPYSQQYSPYIPDCWTEAQGRLGTTNTTFTSTTTSGWQSRPFGNIGANLGANLQIYGASTDEWLISPTIDFGSDPNIARIVEFDYALTETGTSNLGVFGDDDSVAFVVSYDNGITWKQPDILGVWDTSSTISAGANHFLYELRNTTGKLKFGFYATSTVSNLYSRFHIDNFSIQDTLYWGIGEYRNFNNFKVYPNPNDGQFTLLNNGKTKNYTINVMDMQGRIVFTETKVFGTNQSNQIDISSFSKGVYLLQLVSEERMEQHRIVVR